MNCCRSYPGISSAGYIRLSADGERQLNAALRARLALLERGLDSWAPEDLEQLDRLLTRFVSDIDRETKDSENR
jgi:DNA-binding MarR family transcriptional regulator